MLKVVSRLLLFLFLALTPMVAVGDGFHFAGEEYPPFSFTENGIPVGISIDILKEICTEADIPESIALYPWARAYETALQRKNTAVFTTARIKEREELFRWVGPIAPRRIVLYKLRSRMDIRAASLEEAKKYIVGTISGFAAERSLMNAGFEPGRNLQSVPVISQNLKKLFAGRIDLITALDVSLPYILKGKRYDVNDLEEVVLLDDKIGFYYAFNRDSDAAMLDRFQAILDEMKADGRYDKILEKYR